MQISRRRRSRGLGGPLRGCSVSAAGNTSRGGHMSAVRVWQQAPHHHAPGLTHVQSGGESIEARHWCGVLATGQVQAWASAEGSHDVGLRSTRARSPGVRPCSTLPTAPHSPGSRPRAHEVHAAPPVHPGAGDSGTRPLCVVPVGPEPGPQPAPSTGHLGPGHCHAPGWAGPGRGCPNLVW